MRRFAVLALLLVAAATRLSAQASPPPPPQVCASSPERHQFDFWIGTWEVRNAAGALAGHSVVQSISGGCAMLENWTGINGGQGKSINAWNPATRQWQQYWIGQDGNPVEFRESELKGRAIAFLARTGDRWQRLTFSPIDDHTVRQFAELSTDGGRTWQTTYDFRYTRSN